MSASPSAAPGQSATITAAVSESTTVAGAVETHSSDADGSTSTSTVAAQTQTTQASASLSIGTDAEPSRYSASIKESVHGVLATVNDFLSPSDRRLASAKDTPGTIIDRVA